MNSGRSPEMNFGPRHHSGMPNAAELKWRESIQRAAYEERYYPHGRPFNPRVGMNVLAEGAMSVHDAIMNGESDQVVKDTVDRAVGAAWWVKRLIEYSDTHPEVRDALDTALERMQTRNAGSVEGTNPDFLPTSSSEMARRHPEDRYWQQLAKQERAWNNRMD